MGVANEDHRTARWHREGNRPERAQVGSRRLPLAVRRSQPTQAYHATFIHLSETLADTTQVGHRVLFLLTSAPKPLMAEGIPANVIQQQLGHSSLQVTSVYLDHIAPKDRIERIRAREWAVNV